MKLFLGLDDDDKIQKKRMEDFHLFYRNLLLDTMVMIGLVELGIVLVDFQKQENILCRNFFPNYRMLEDVLLYLRLVQSLYVECKSFFVFHGHMDTYSTM